MKNKKINYVEFPASDFKKTKTFFETVFNWTFTDYGENYIAFSNAGLDGGFYKAETRSQTANGSSLVVFYADDLETVQTDILNAGGKIVNDIFSFPGGRRFHFADPNGNEWAVWSDK